MTDDGIPRRGRSLKLAVLGLLPVLGVVALMFAPLPAFVVGPGPVISITEGLVVNGEPVQGQIDGDFLFTTIAAQSARGHDIVAASFDSETRVLSRSQLIPAGMTEEAFVVEQEGKFADSVASAAQAAGEVLGDQSPEVELDGGVVGGPSAGLLISLAIYDAVSQDDVAASRRISGTGEVQADGTVTSVGSISFKVRGAAEAGSDIFLVPSSQLAQAEQAVPADSDMIVRAVDTVAEAVQELTQS